MSHGWKIFLIVTGITTGAMLLAAVVVSIVNALTHHQFFFGLIVGLAAGVGLTLLALRLRSWWAEHLEVYRN